MFVALCEELCQLQLQILRRDGAPATLAQHLVRLVRQHYCGSNSDYNYSSSSSSAVASSSSSPYTSALDEQAAEQSSLYAHAAHDREQRVEHVSRHAATPAVVGVGGVSTAACVPLFLRCCATACKHLPDAESSDALCMLDMAHAVASDYVFADHGDVNEAGTVLRSVLTLSEWQQTRHEEQQLLRHGDASPQPQRDGVHNGKRSNNNNTHALATLVPYAYKVALQKWCAAQPLHRQAALPSHSHSTYLAYNSSSSSSSGGGDGHKLPHCLTTLSLLRGCSAVHGRDFRFTATSADMHGLLPCKSHLQMEAKVQQCDGARALLHSLRDDYAMGHIDAGMCVATMASTGLYDAEVCAQCCRVLQQSRAMLTSQQLCDVLFHLGVLQHRPLHVNDGSSSSRSSSHSRSRSDAASPSLVTSSSSSSSMQQQQSQCLLRSLSSCVQTKHCNAAAVRRHVVALAMLRQPPPCERTLMDGVFMHALRASHARQQHYHPHRHGNNNNNNTAQRQQPRQRHVPPHADAPVHRNSSNSYAALALPAAWYVDIAHALACLGVEHHKYCLATARQAQRVLPQLSTEQCCKLLYGIGGVHTSAHVPSELRDAWQRVVTPTMAAATRQLCTLDHVDDGPRVMRALLYCGVDEHPRIPRAPPLHGRDAASAATPSDALRQTWTTPSSSSHERVLCASLSTTAAQGGGSDATAVAPSSSSSSSSVAGCPKHVTSS